MRYVPIFMDARGLRVVVVGGGVVAERKIRPLLKAGAEVVVVAAELNATVKRWSDEARLQWAGTTYSATALEGARLVYAATSDQGLNRRVAGDAELLGVPVNVVDNPGISRFISPAVVDRAPVQVAISTAGTSPVLARRLRSWIERLLPESLGAMAEAASRLRPDVRRELPTPSIRGFWERLFSDRGVRDAAAAGADAIEAEWRRRLVEESSGVGSARQQGRVYLVGAGPGRPGLLTLRAVELLECADVIVHDSLVPEAILDRARRDADRIDVGKRCGGKQTRQHRIHRILEREAGAGRLVVRLKGGDPFIFGRGGEELEFLRSRGIRCEVVPGITAASACAAATGIPLTHRGESHAISYVTGHRAFDVPEDSAAWAELVRPGRTVAVYMGRRQAGRIRRGLIGAGVDPATPVAVIANGGLPKQQLRSGALRQLETLAASVDADAPALIIIGQVAARAGTLEYFGPVQNEGLERAA